ncbi:carboxypeptidase-like regulatory domain-containing protein [Nocardioides marmoribigeumensis]|jgi:hypothetical protein|uniref:Carboxypeptidase regulatory-like domain-containing protein n=1 Tax=Nocardioides marmoribigeumensis TaxID=433649 RepID=A0ABU2BSQ5_9ACTN|nr:hypothetical protein [Nocardioides marmoribigeumensis]MDR7361672.1 hypothetical protein [Nocardioides marmoribigeumensis]
MNRTAARRPRRLLTLLLGVVLGLGVVVLPAGGAGAAVTPTLTLALSRSTGVFWDTQGPAIADDEFRVTGYLRDDQGRPMAGRTIRLLQKRTHTESDYRLLTQKATTDANGRYVFDRRVVATAAYATYFAGDTDDTDGTYGEVRSDVARRIRAMRDFNAGKRRVDGKLYFRGDVNPGWGGRRVVLQRQTCRTCAWRTVASRTAGRGGGWSFRVTYPAKVGPVWRWQAVLAAAGDFERSYSAQLTTQRVYTRKG